MFKIENGIPLHEAAAFFLKMKTAAPDETGALEGQFAAPVEEVLAHMAEMVQNELKTHYAYIVYSESLRDFAHHSIAQELRQHAYHETEHAEFLLRRMSVLGGAVEVPDIPAPPPSSDPIEIVKTMIQMEQEGIANWQALRKLVGEDNPTRFKIEEYLTKEQEHLDELWQLLPHTEAAATAGTPPAAVDPQAGPPMTVATPDEAVDTEAAAAKTAAARVERFHPETMRFHGAAMKLALASMSPTVFVPEIDLEGNLKTAAARMKRANAMMAEAGPAMGKVPPPAPPPPALTGAAAGQHAKMAARFKLALDAMGAAPAPPPSGGQEASELDAYLAEESAAQQEQNVAEDTHYRERFTEAMQRLQQAEQAQQAAEEQVAQLTEQAAMSSETNQQALAQAQQIQDQAMQQVNAANTAAAAAMQKSLAASNETLQQQQLATQMRDAMQTLKTQLMGIVNTQLPPSTTMEAGVSAAADQAAADQQAQEQALMGGQDPSGNQAGTPAASGDAGTPPGSSTPGKDGPGTSPTASDPSSSPAAEKKTESSESAPDDDKPSSSEKEASDRFIGGLMGAGIGAGVTALENRGRAGSNSALRGKVQKLEAAEQAGEGGFGNAMNIAASKMRLAAGELAEKHPHAATALGAGLGAMAGMNAAPHVRDLANTIRG